MLENISNKPLNDLIAEQDKKQNIHHLIILDFIRILQQKATSSQALLSTLLNLTDEGVKRNMFFGQEYDLQNRIQIGIITSITPAIFNKHFYNWNQNGTMTRWLFCSYQYSDDTREEIKQYISKNVPALVNNAVSTIKRRRTAEIPISSDIGVAIKLKSDEVEKRLKQFYVVRQHGKNTTKVYFDLQGFRLQKMLRILAQSIAYDRNHDSVNYEDLQELYDICELIRLPNEPKVI